MPVSTKTPRPTRRSLRLAVLVLLALGGCKDGDEALRLADLTPAEELYVTRFVVLERARAVARLAIWAWVVLGSGVAQVSDLGLGGYSGLGGLMLLGGCSGNGLGRPPG